MPLQAWRLCRSKYNVLDGQGAAKYGGRWNSPGQQVVYLSLDPALCILEILVNLDLPIELIPKDYELVCVEYSIDKSLNEEDLIWTIDTPEYSYQQSQTTGDNWLTTQKTLSLSVPSVVVPEMDPKNWTVL